MESNKLTSPSLEKAIQLSLPENIVIKAKASLDEDASYAADELVELAEEILSHIAAAGIAHYLQSDTQKEVYNDFLLQLFTSSGQEYNAGPLYRWAANMIYDCPGMRKSKKFGFFWEAKDVNEVLCSRVNALAELRNRVMHGFFVLPPEENLRQAEAIGNLLLELADSGIFKIDANFHFIQNGSFSGRWNIIEDSDWQQLKERSSFGQLVEQILKEQNEFFWEEEKQFISNQANKNILLPADFNTFIQNNNRGAIAFWVHPAEKNADAIFANMAFKLQRQKDCLLLAYSFNEKGISFTSEFLLDRLLKILNTSNGPLSSKKKAEEHVSRLRKEYKGRVIVLVNRIHIALFSPQHLTKLNNFLFDNDILLLAVGHHYEHFDSFFNQTISLSHPSVLPDITQRKEILHNYLRFKGPHVDKKEDWEDVQKLCEILDKLSLELEKGREVYARRFADDNGFDMEYVLEIFALLHPWVHSGKKPFEEDTIDELYGFPTNITETTPIYLALGRRDLKLEYRHKVLSMHPIQA